MNNFLYLTSVPPEVQASEFEDVLKRQGIVDVTITLSDAVQPNERLYPHAYYEWMPKNGTLRFETMSDTERALAILANHPYLVGYWRIVISPIASAHSPMPPSQVAPLIIRPIGVEDEIQIPSDGEVWDATRVWGPIRTVSVNFEIGKQNQAGSPSVRWIARVEFWYEDDAMSFEVATGAAGLLMGRRVDVHKDPSFIPAAPLWFQPPPSFPHQPHPPQGYPPYSGQVPYQHPPPPLPPPDGPPLHAAMNALSIHGPPMATQGSITQNGTDGKAEDSATLTVETIPSTHRGDSSVVDTKPPPADFIQGIVPVGGGFPPSPAPTTFQPPPWSSHHKSAGGVPLPYTPPQEAVPLRNQGAYGRNRGRGGRQTSWRKIPGGVVSTDGSTIQHRPGQHIQPAPTAGRGSHSTSGLVDYCNLMVKHLDPDINSDFLGDLFSQFGPVINSRVMRDHSGQPRGYGFVSFYNPDDAARALAEMDKTRLGTRYLSITYHEPRPWFNRREQYPAKNGRFNSPHPRPFNHQFKADGATPKADTQPVATGASPAATPKAATMAVQPAQPSSHNAELPAGINPETVTIEQLTAMSPAIALLVLKSSLAVPNRLGLQPSPKATIPFSIRNGHATKMELIHHMNRLGNSANMGKAKSRTMQRIRGYINALDENNERAFAELISYPDLALPMALNARR